MTNTPQWKVMADAESVAAEAARRILAQAGEAISERGVFRIVLAGGTTPEKTYRLLTDADTDWLCWQIYYGDERCLPVEHDDRNSRMAQQAWLRHVPIPAENIHPMPAEQGAEPAARHYSGVIEGAVPFDMVLLGMGEDGHTASLFPGHQYDRDEAVHAVHNAPKPPPDRVSLSAATLSNTRALLILVTGAGKREAVSRWRRGEDLPIARVTPPGTVVLIDRDAMAGA
jgi:6-phosphogluconolactonase